VQWKKWVKWGMIPEKVFQQILALGEAWRVTRMNYQEKEQRVLIRVEETPALPFSLVQDFARIHHRKAVPGTAGDCR
jgi:hypothetical protein